VTSRLLHSVQVRFIVVLTLCALFLAPLGAVAAPYAAFVMDARTGEVLHSRNADSRLHPASLTKMMTLYVTFEAIRKGEISLNTKVRISKKAAAEPPSKLGLRAGQRIELRYLIRAASVKSANDAATALGEAVSGSEAAFARRMNRTAKALGMTRTTFKNAHGLTEKGHLSTARDMATLGRRLFYDYPQYYNLFSRLSTDTSVKKVNNTNTKFLKSYRGADGIKTGYTQAAGFNLVASAERGNERIIAAVFGGRSTASRNAKMTELLDLGFRRAPSSAKIVKPKAPVYGRKAVAASTPGAKGKTIRLVMAVKKSMRPQARPTAVGKPNEATMLALADGVTQALQVIASLESEKTEGVQEDVQTMAALAPTTNPIETDATLDVVHKFSKDPVPLEVVTRATTSGGQFWGISLGSYNSYNQAERLLLKTALSEIETLEDALRKVVKGKRGYEANFVGMSEQRADLACSRLNARGFKCAAFGP